MENTSQPDFAVPQSPPPMQGKLSRRARSIAAIVLREMGTKYGRNPGGYLWALLEPLGGLLLLSIGFSLLLRAPSLGSSFLMFYATGIMPFQLFQSISNAIANCLNYSRALLKYPSVSWIDAVFARMILYTLTGCVVSVIIFAGVIEYVEFRSSLSFGPIFAAFGLAALLGLGIGVVNAVIAGLIPVWRSVWRIIMRPLFLASAILFIVEDMPAVVQDILWYNPLSHVTALMREGFYQSYSPQHVSVIFVLSVGLVTTAFGLLLMRRFHLKILEN